MRWNLLMIVLLLFASCNGQNRQENTGPGTTVTTMEGGVMAIFQDRKNNLWFGAKGVYQYDGKKLVHYSVEDGLVSESVLGIQEDKAGNIYFDTPEGVSRFDGEKFTTLEFANSLENQNEWVLNPNDLWFRMGWNAPGPYRYDGQVLHALEFPKTEQEDVFYKQYPNASFNPYGIYSLYKDRKGNMWFGTSSLGVCRFDGQSVKWLYEEAMTTIPGGGALGIRSVLEDREGDFWFTNTRYRYQMLSENGAENETSNIRYERAPGVGHVTPNGEVKYPYFMAITEDQRGDLWMAGYDEGVWRNDGDKVTNFPLEGLLVFTIYVDRQGGVWLGTHNDGVYRFDGEQFVKFE